MKLAQVLSEIIGPAYGHLPSRMQSREADVMLLAIGLQESRFTTRRQKGGPARGFWQFEKGGGVKGVLTHRASRASAIMVCEDRGVSPTAAAVYPALERDDILAACFARLLLWTDQAKLPAIGDEQGAWDCYIRNWRPGKPHRDTWDSLYAQARQAGA